MEENNVVTEIATDAQSSTSTNGGSDGLVLGLLLGGAAIVGGLITHFVVRPLGKKVKSRYSDACNKKKIAKAAEERDIETITDVHPLDGDGSVK